MTRTLSAPAHRPIVDDAPMPTFTHYIDQYVIDKSRQGAFNSPRTELDYRRTLELHAQDVGNRDPAYTTREHVKHTLSRWDNPTTAAKNLAHMRSFYKWAMQEGHRRDNPAEQVPTPKKRPVAVYRMTRQETLAFMAAARTTRERRIAYLGCCAGLRRSELLGMQGRHFRRPGFIHVSADIAKGGKERYVPVIVDLEPIVADIVANVAPDEYVIPSQRKLRGLTEYERVRLPASPQTLKTSVEKLGERAGIQAHIHPHLMRHAFGDHIARYAGMFAAQSMMGHADISTTRGTYMGDLSLDELAAATRNFSFTGEQVFGRPGNHPETPSVYGTSIEPVNGTSPEIVGVLPYEEGA